MTQPRIGFLGAGHMSGAIIAGLLSNPETGFSAKQLSATCRQQANAQRLSKHYAINAHCDNLSLIHNSDFIVLGVKPQQIHVVLSQIAACDLEKKVIISLAAGIALEKYRQVLGEVTLVRAMPNIAVASQAGLTGLYTDSELSTSEEATIDALFSAVGSTAWLDDEVQLDGITALSGSGIAFIFRYLQAMVEAGEHFGFERDELYDIVTLTVMGAATLALETDDPTPDFDTFCRQIAVEGGTTAQGLATLDSHKLNQIVLATLQATIEKSRDLGDTLTQNW